MNSSDKIKSHYSFTIEDIQNLQKLHPIFEKYQESFARDFYDCIKGYENISAYLKNEETIIRHKKGMVEWLMNLFKGDYGDDYVKKLEKIGTAHVKVGLPSHYVNASMNFVEQFCLDVLDKEFEDKKDYRNFSRSLTKILDINLDVMTGSYLKEEVNRFFLIQKLEDFLITFSNRFAYGLNLVLVLGLVIMGALAIGLFCYDLTHILDGDIEKGLLSTLGSLLMLWMVIELIDTEIKHLKGGKFAVKVFVGVALVAVIRKILVSTLSSGEVNAQIFLIVSLAVLGVVYWLTSRVE